MDKPALYRHIATLAEHSHSVNAVAFSPDGLLLATGGDDGLLLIYGLNVTTKSWTEKYRFQSIGAITCLVWNPRFESVLVAGNRNGDVHIIRLVFSRYSWSGTWKRNSVIWRFSRRSSVHCITMNQKATMMAIGHGNNVSIMKQGTPSAFDDISIIPDPPVFPELEGSLPRPIARSLHFLDDDILIVTYLQHGIAAFNVNTYNIQWQIRPRTVRIGASSLSPDGAMLVVTNLYDGLDFYSVPGRRLASTAMHTIGQNVPIPVEHIHDGSDVLFGGSTGCARILHKANAETTAVLDHDDELVQAIAYCRRRPRAWWGRGFADQIATAVSESGSHTEVKIWSGSEDPRDTFAKFATSILTSLQAFVPSPRDWAVVTITVVVAVLIAVIAPAGRLPTTLDIFFDAFQWAGRLILEPLAWTCNYVYAIGQELIYVYHRAEDDTVIDAWYSQWSSSYQSQTMAETATPATFYSRSRLTAIPI